MLANILEAKKYEVEKLRQTIDIDSSFDNLGSSGFLRALVADPSRVALIAEVKKASPVKGILNNDLDPQELANVYQANGAAAVSVITDRQFFNGNRDYIPLIKQKLEIPVLRKEFIIDEIQLYETVMLGADAILLIAAALDYSTLLSLIEKSLCLGLEPLVEVHDHEELKMVLDTPALLLGINNRNLKTFVVDINTSLELAAEVPNARIKVSESGVSRLSDIELLHNAGFNAVLVGEALVTAGDIPAKVRELSQFRS
ncbi:MAG: indole-3-glycerol phosphate synthase TrpC [Candidatus Saccharibacteria bacterium]